MLNPLTDILTAWAYLAAIPIAAVIYAAGLLETPDRSGGGGLRRWLSGKAKPRIAVAASPIGRPLRMVMP